MSTGTKGNGKRKQPTRRHPRQKGAALSLGTLLSLGSEKLAELSLLAKLDEIEREYNSPAAVAERERKRRDEEWKKRQEAGPQLMTIMRR